MCAKIAFDAFILRKYLGHLIQAILMAHCFNTIAAQQTNKQTNKVINIKTNEFVDQKKKRNNFQMVVSFFCVFENSISITSDYY